MASVEPPRCAVFEARQRFSTHWEKYKTLIVEQKVNVTRSPKNTKNTFKENM